MTAIATDTDRQQEKAAEFAERMLGVINDGALALMTSVGHRTGLFDTMAELPPADSRRIAEAAGLDERYVREWLGAMTTGGIVECDRAGRLFRLPGEHAAVLTRAANPDNMAVTTQYIAVLGGVEDQIVECFRHGGGVPYEDFPRFHEVMAEESAQSVVAALIDDIVPLVPGLSEKLEAGISVVDVGCGSGRAMNLLARHFPNSRFQGYDFSDEAVTRARAEAARFGTTNASFERRDAGDLGVEEFDLVTAFDAIHDQAAPAAVLEAIRQALKPGGIFLMQDIGASSHVHGNLDHPLGPILYTTSCMHCMTVSLAQGGAGLGAMWGEQTARRMLAEAGFASVTVQALEHDPQNYYYVAA
ncbi:MAG: class I SAM-dependent methyltransferase [Alphaproteobacteria bacterium]|nr:class I SAM-dependent methyltransferase [Alphaproteobacteria bacterium]